MFERARKEAPSVGRRRFVLWLGGAGLLPVAAWLGSLLGLSLGAPGAGAQTGGAAPATPPSAPPAAPPAMGQGAEHKISDEAKSLHAILMARYGKDLDEAQSQGLLEAIDGSVQGGQALRKQKLANSVEPATAFWATPLASTPAPKGSTASATKGGR